MDLGGDQIVNQYMNKQFHNYLTDVLQLSNTYI
jgi:hypothetical protein